MIDASKSKVLYRKTHGHMPLITKAHEWSLVDSTGRSYHDMSGGACFASLGYSAWEISAAAANQMSSVPYAFSGYWATVASEQAGEWLAEEFERANPGWFGKVIFQQGGGEAVDLACKLAAQYHAEADEDRRWIVSRECSYHGVSLLPFALSGYYPRYEKIYDYESGVRCTSTRQMQHPCQGNIRPPILQWDEAALLVEPVSGPQLGCWVEGSAYMQRLREACDESGALLIYDEILCGSGRCGYISTAEFYGVWPDIILLGKGLAAGYQPVSAIVMSKKVVDRIAQGSGYAMFGTAFSAHSVGCAAVAATLKYMREHDLYDVVRSHTQPIWNCISDDVWKSKGVMTARGLGHLWGLSFWDPETAEPFPPEREFHLRVRAACMDDGIVTYSKGQTVNGAGDFLTIAPAYNMPMHLIEAGLQKIAVGIRKAYQEEKARVPASRD